MSMHRAGTFTGRHMLLTMLAFFGVIVGVNVTMAFFARSSWTGFVVANSYVASQEFNHKMALTRAQAALGWRSQFRVEDSTLRYSIRNAAGGAVPLTGVRVTFRRPIDDREDHAVALVADKNGGFSLSHSLADGTWIAEVEAEAGLTNPYRETLRLRIVGGSGQ